MTRFTSSQTRLLAAGMAVCAVALAPDATASSEHVYRDFKYSAAGAGIEPVAGVVRDAQGNVYGATAYGGAANSGIVYRITADSQYSVLYSFTGGADGSTPVGGLIFDGFGNLYGTTSKGGLNYGTVFELSPPPPGKKAWTLTTLHSFQAGADGAFPQGRVMFDFFGHLYGTTMQGGTSDYGTVFELTPGGPETVIYSFKGAGDGRYPMGGLTADASGNLFGTASQTGATGLGVIFELHAQGGSWLESVVHNFAGQPGDGDTPLGDLAIDANGNFYGTTSKGGADNLGTVFELVPPHIYGLSRGHARNLPIHFGSWTVYVLHSFSGSDGAGPISGVAVDAASNIYGTTPFGGALGHGAAYKVGASGLSYTVLHSFANASDGGAPEGDVLLDSAGGVWGTTASGAFGVNDGGVVFRITP
jgi:uncharacterized repeat protein (TIGR03803 family)